MTTAKAKAMAMALAKALAMALAKGMTMALAMAVGQTSCDDLWRAGVIASSWKPLLQHLV